MAKKKSFQGFARSVRNKAISHLFLIAAAIAAAIAYPLYHTSTKAPDVELTGFAMVYVDAPAVSAKVTMTYASDYKRTGNDVSFGDPDLGSDNITALVITTSLSGASPNSMHHYLLVLGGDARLTRTDLRDGPAAHSANGTRINYPGMSAQANIQEFEGTIFGSSQQQMAGYLTTKVVDTGSGKTLVRIPSMGSAADSTTETFGPAVNETMKPQEVLVAGKRWYLPKTAKYNAIVGLLPAGIDVDEARPQIDSGNPTVLQWSGSNVELPQALLSNDVAEGQATKQLFFAGVLAGLAGGFLVEGLSRLRPGEEKSLFDSI